MDKHNIRRGETITFADTDSDGEFVERTVYPLTLKALRKFVAIVNAMEETKDATAMTDDDITLMFQASRVILERVDPQLAADQDKLEDAIDLFIFGKLMQVAMGNASPEA